MNYFENGEVTQFPAVVAAVTDADGSGVAILRTYILDGRKAPVANPRKLTAGGIPAGSAVRLRQAARKMGVAEGIENALAASVLFDVPVWAALTAAGLKRWTPPSEAEEIYIFGDNDRTGIGQGAAEALAVKLRAQGLAVTVRIPDMAGEDWNDALLSKISVGYIRRPPARANQELEALNLRPSHYSHQTTELGGPRHQEPPLR
ncbi:hypothetical protein X758_19130 [Mesorhizobium sp. LSHC416B00]|nr:hypothetical protein X761_29085 [Mesorhizobium sp. LSHC424B00]ESX69937.1 hypothetical protein X758_19130 [Mesorhizobium sp. LSHC416B00]